MGIFGQYNWRIKKINGEIPGQAQNDRYERTYGSLKT